MIWVFSLLMWHCMSRSINVGILSLSNFNVFNDCITIKHYTTKTEKTGEKINNKHCYCNAEEPCYNLFLALAVYFTLNQLHFKESSYLFKKSDTEDKAGSNGYCSQLSELFASNSVALSCFIRAGHANAHGFRKGSSTHAASGTTLSPSITSIAKRGDWSLGKILDIYWKFAEAGDQFLGRVLALFCPNSEGFDALPPHFIMNDPMDDEDVKMGMELCFGVMVENHTDPFEDPTSICLLLLASLVNDCDWLLKTGAKYSCHPFSSIPLLNHPELIKKLQQKTTTKPGLMTPTGIPPHIEQAKVCKVILEKCDNILDQFEGLHTKVEKVVEDVLEKTAYENGHLTVNRFAGMVGDMTQSILGKVDEKNTGVIDEMRKTVTDCMNQLGTNTFENSNVNSNVIRTSVGNSGNSSEGK